MEQALSFEKFHKSLINFTFFAATFDAETHQDDFTWLKKTHLMTGDILLRKNKSSRMQKQIIDASYGNIYQHCGIMYNSTHIFEMIVPRGRIIPLTQFLRRTQSVTLIKLKLHSEDLRYKAKLLMERAVGVKYGLLEHLDICTIQHYMHYLGIFRPEWRPGIQTRIKSFLQGNKDYITCSDTIMTILMRVAPRLREAVLRCRPFINLFKYGIFRPDDFMSLATFNPGLFEIVNPPTATQDSKLLSLISSTSVREESKYTDHEDQIVLQKQASFTLSVAWHLGRLVASPKVESHYQKLFEYVQQKLLRAAEAIIIVANAPKDKEKEKQEPKVPGIIEEIIPDLIDPHPDNCKRHIQEIPSQVIPRM